MKVCTSALPLPILNGVSAWNISSVFHLVFLSVSSPVYPFSIMNVGPEYTKHIYQFDIANKITNLFNEMQSFFLFTAYRWSAIVGLRSYGKIFLASQHTAFASTAFAIWTIYRYANALLLLLYFTKLNLSGNCSAYLSGRWAVPKYIFNLYWFALIATIIPEIRIHRIMQIFEICLQPASQPRIEMKL